MSKFKIGDYVEIIAWNGNSSDGNHWVGTKGHIKKVSNFGGWDLDVSTPGAYWTDNELKLAKEKSMAKFYKTLKDLPGWDAGAILEETENGNFAPISDLWDTDAVEDVEDYAENGDVVKNSPDWFERVYEVSVLGKAKYLAKEAAKKVHDELHKAK